MIIKKEAFPIKAERLMQWHQWFAWHPVRIDEQRLAWLINLQRRANESSWDGYGGAIWEYREMPNEQN